MLRLIEHPGTVHKLAHKLRTQLFKAASTGPKVRTTAARAVRWKQHIVHFDEGDWWYGYGERPNAYANSIGFGNPFQRADAPTPVIELNPPKGSISRQLQGAFAEDESGIVYVVHRGTLGGGGSRTVKGFLDGYPSAGKRQMIDSEGRRAAVIVVGRIGDSGLLAGVRALGAIAKAHREGRRAGKSALADATTWLSRDEFAGIVNYRQTEREITAEHRHGVVWKALRDELRALRAHPRRTQMRDMVAASAGGQPILFEIKTSCDSQSLYTALGQLYWHSSPGTIRVVVVPREISSESRLRFEALGVRCLRYSWNNGEPRIDEVAETVAYCGIRARS